MKPNDVQTKQLTVCQVTMGVEVDWVFKDDVSIEVGGKDESEIVVALLILKVGRPFAVKWKFRTVSNVFGSSLFLTVAINKLITAL